MSASTRQGITYDDVLLVPKRSSVKSRKQITTRTRFSRRIWLNIPIVSSNMDTVTEAEMAIAMARCGGLGIVHRFMSVDDQVAAIRKVKRSESYKIEQPYKVGPDTTIGELEAFMRERGVKSVLVADAKSYLLGIVTARDMLVETENKSAKITLIMTPREKMIVADENVTMQDASSILSRNRIEKLPLVDANNEIKGLITSKDILNLKMRPHASVDLKGRLIVGAAVGVKDGFLERAQALVDADVDVLVVDIAHGHSDLAIDATRELKKRFPNVDVVAGNVATAEGTRDLILAGADGIKVGVGPGSICITRIVTGCGVPQLTAIMDCAEEAKKHDIPIIADGGIKVSGDIVKALAGGANTVMLGNVLAGTEESPGQTLIKDGKKVKIIRGMAGFGANMSKKERDQEKSTDVFEVVPEGVEGLVPYRGHVKDVISQLVGGLQSGISYCGGTNIEEMQKNAEFMRITGAGKSESSFHDIHKI